MRKDGLMMTEVVDFRPLPPGSQGGGALTHGNTVAAGNLVIDPTNLVDEIAVGRRSIA